MIISINWLKKFTDINLPIDELTTLIGARLVEIEDVTNIGEKYKNVLVAEVKECVPVEDSDHLNLVKLDDGGKNLEVDRDENGYVQVVCGAPNVRVGLRIAWLPPGVIVPETFGKSNEFTLGKRPLRGHMSNGMIASARELDLFDEHDGILELDQTLAPGTAFVDAYELDDYLLDIENKSLTHRPDAFGIIGFAREVAAIQGRSFVTPDWLTEVTPRLSDSGTSNVTVSIDESGLSKRYSAIVLSGAGGQVKSPLYIQSYLARVGIRPISAVVDVTNYLMMLTGQPLHAFDYDKVVKLAGEKPELHVRSARKNEPLKLLDGRTIMLSEEDIVIAAGEQVIGLAGAMGGADTEIDEHTKTIILESATFDLYKLRATQMRHGIFSEAVTRFTKGQPAALTAPVLSRAVQLLGELTGAKPVTNVIESYPDEQVAHSITLTCNKINDVLGAGLQPNVIIETLKNVEFIVVIDRNTLTVTPPYWRNDIHIDEDIIEEVGRINGFDSIRSVLPRREVFAVRPDQFDKMRTDIRRALSRSGANEVLTYSFVHGDMLTKVDQRAEDSYRLVNSISPELQYYRQTLTPSLLNAIHPNVKQGYKDFALFELNKVHPKQQGKTEEGVPSEVHMLALALTRTSSSDEGAPYYGAKRFIDFLGESLGLDLFYTPLVGGMVDFLAAPFEPKRSALVTDKKTDTIIGIVGEYKKSVSSNFKLPEYAAGFEVNLESLYDATQKLTASYRPISRYPSAERDICFQIDAETHYQAILDAINEALSEVNLEADVQPLDIYKQNETALKKNITIRVRLTAHDHTLIGEEVATVIKKVTDNVIAATSAVII